MVEELDGSGMPAAHYAQGLGIDEPLAMNRGAVTSFYQADGLGSITSLSDGSGQVAASYTYDSFGNVTNSTGSLVNPFRYTGREFDSETGLYYYRARYYDSLFGRFLSEDPIGFRGSVDFYKYVRNDPTVLKDPTGLIHQAWNEPPFDGRLHDDAGGGLEVLCRDKKTKARDIEWLAHSIAVREAEIAELGDDANLGHIDRLDAEKATLARCSECEDRKPEPFPVDVPEWKNFLKRNRKPILIGVGVIVGAAAVALAPETGGASLLLFAAP